MSGGGRRTVSESSVNIGTSDGGRSTAVPPRSSRRSHSAFLCALSYFCPECRLPHDHTHDFEVGDVLPWSLAPSRARANFIQRIEVHDRGDHAAKGYRKDVEKRHDRLLS